MLKAATLVVQMQFTDCNQPLWKFGGRFCPEWQWQDPQILQDFLRIYSTNENPNGVIISIFQPLVIPSSGKVDINFS